MSDTFSGTSGEMVGMVEAVMVDMMAVTLLLVGVGWGPRSVVRYTCDTQC